MSVYKNLSLVGLLAVTVMTFTACSTSRETAVETNGTPSATTTTSTTETTATAGDTGANEKAGPDVSKPVAGSPATANLARKGAEVKQDAKVDPYTGTTDQKNYVGRHPIAKNQSVADHAQNDASGNNNTNKN